MGFQKYKKFDHFCVFYEARGVCLGYNSTEFIVYILQVVCTVYTSRFSKVRVCTQFCTYLYCKSGTNLSVFSTLR